MDEQRKQLLESIPGKDAVKIVETTTQNFEYYINLEDYTTAGFKSIDSNLERSFKEHKMSSNGTACYT